MSSTDVQTVFRRCTSVHGRARCDTACTAAAPRPETATGYRVGGTDGSHFDPSMLYAAAKLYYLEDATQAEVAAQLGTSRATVSRLLSEARRQGIVKIQVIAPDATGHRRPGRAAGRRARASPRSSSPPRCRADRVRDRGRDGQRARARPSDGRSQAVGLTPGDVLLVSSGRTVYEVVALRAPAPARRGRRARPSGGTDQPEAWYQTNEITRLVAERIGGRAMYLFAPALPGPELYATLQHDPTIQRVLHLWPHARCVLTGIGAPPLLRAQAPQFIDTSSAALVEAVGDICSRFFSRSGEPGHVPRQRAADRARPGDPQAGPGGHRRRLGRRQGRPAHRRGAGGLLRPPGDRPADRPARSWTAREPGRPRTPAGPLLLGHRHGHGEQQGRAHHRRRAWSWPPPSATGRTRWRGRVRAGPRSTPRRSGGPTSSSISRELVRGRGRRRGRGGLRERRRTLPGAVRRGRPAAPTGHPLRHRHARAGRDRRAHRRARA